MWQFYVRGKQLNSNQIQGAGSRKAYNFLDFYNDCKSHRERIEIESDAKTDAKNVLHLFGEGSLEDQILDFIVQHNSSEYKYKNTDVYHKGTEKDKLYKPLVDAYILPLKFFDLYVAFCIQKTGAGWIIKSIHSNNSHSGNGETISIGSYLKITGNLI